MSDCSHEWEKGKQGPIFGVWHCQKCDAWYTDFTTRYE
jgi:hypothetical protein